MTEYIDRADVIKLITRRYENPEICEQEINEIPAVDVMQVLKTAVEQPCEICNGKTTLYQHTNTTKLYMNTFGKAATLVTECVGCPPYADCCMKGISANSAFRIKYCPECGRPLTEEAWDKLEKRMKAMEQMGV